uniref:DDE Tnp4 domain-containing protein n=1 Tax=Sparus aurata TaxID=8175 RepID=A0A671VQ44_SPAAU
MAYEEQDEAAALYISYVMYMIIQQTRFTLALMLAVISEERRYHHMLQAGAMQTTNLLLNFGASLLQRRSQRTCWMRVRSKDWWERVVLKEFDDEEWKENFRMTRRSFNKLCGMMEGVLKPEDVTVRAPVPLEMRVAIVLYKLASCAEYRVVANQFGIPKSTVKKFVYKFCKGMVSSVIHKFIKVPTTEEAISIARRFEQKFHIPQIIGCIDGTHIPVLLPNDGYKDFANRKGWPSYVLQAMVDNIFWDINCKIAGCAHDANVLRQSTLFSQAHLLPKVKINGISIGHFLLGDPAYPLLDWLMKGYTHSPNITPEQESFNVHLSSRSDFHFTFTPHIIATCCALHNFCESEKESVDPTSTVEAAVLEADLPQPSARAYNSSDNASAQRIRGALTDSIG